MRGKDVVYVGGSDEHGAAITIQAKREGTTPQAIIDKYHALNKETFERFGISFDMYHRTSEKIHHELSQEFFLNLYEKGERSEEHTSELQSLMRIAYAVFCLKKKRRKNK